MKKDFDIENQVRSARISVGFSNYSKVFEAKKTDAFVKDLKNKMSAYILENIQFLMDDKKEFIRTYVKFNSNVILAWETQTIFHDIVGFYENRIAQIRSKIDTSIQVGYNKKYYKKQTTLKGGIIAKKGSIKDFSIKKKYSDLGKIVKLLTFLDTENLSKYEGAKFYDSILYFQQNKHWDRILKLAKTINNRAFSDIKLIEFETGTYRINLKGNEFILDETNEKFKHWFKHKGVFYPLQINNDYHKLNLLKTSKNKQLTVKVVDNRVDFIFTSDYKPKFKPSKKTVGIDINIKNNFCTTSNRQAFDYDRTYISEFINEIKELDKIGYQNISEAQKKTLKKLINKNEWHFKSLISEVLTDLEKQGCTDIVLEDFNNNTFKASLVENAEFKEKYTRLIRLLRLGNIKKWMTEQAEKRGIRVHLTNPAYTSQECPKCHNIDSNNRPTQEKFKCTECKHTDIADFVSPTNIKNRFHSNVLREKLHKSDNYGRFSPKKISREKLKESLSSFSTSFSKVKQNENFEY